MCCDNHCLFFIKVRTGSLIFGYIAAVLSAIGVLICVGLVLTFLTHLINGVHITDYSFIIIVEISFVELMAGFTCTVLLLYGITTNKPVLVKTYVIYGMIHLVLLVIVVIIIACSFMPIFGILGFIGCGIYTLCIYMVYLTYRGMVHSITVPQDLLNV